MLNESQGLGHQLDELAASRISSSRMNAPRGWVVFLLPLAAACSNDSIETPHVAARANPAESASVVPREFETQVFDRGDGLKVELYSPGRGREARVGSRVRFHYEARVSGQDEIFDATRGTGIPMELVLGSAQDPRPIEGLSRGLVGLRAGSRAKLTIPPKLAWGEAGNPEIGVPPNADVSFAVDVLAVQ
jgi:peptidylprolyl isomerase